MFRSELITTKDSVSRDALAWMLAAQSLSIIPLFFYLPWWLPVIWLVTTLWRVQIYRGVWTFPGTLVKAALGALCVSILLMTFRGRMGVEPMVSFLLCGFLLKLIEANKQRDIIIVLYISFVAIAVQFLFSQTLISALYGLLCLTVLLATQNTLFTRSEKSIRAYLGRAGILLLQSVPLMLVLFIVMPRIGQLWAVPSKQSSSTSGFSDTMSPGSMSQLILSNKLAFRVTFSEEQGSADVEPGSSGNNQPATLLSKNIPSPQERYWRGLVLEYFDGRSWRQRRWKAGVMAGRIESNTTAPGSWDLLVNSAGKTYDYSIILEPHNQPWLFTLMAPVQVDAPEYLPFGFHEDFLLAAKKPVVSRVQYEVTSRMDYQLSSQGLMEIRNKRSLELPKNINPRARKLAESWLTRFDSEAEIIEAALGFYAQNFTYTLNPPLLGSDSIDEFLFITQRGFCEHFASSFTYLMRLAGIPARVVVGYQGGEFNQLENYLMVRQSDAHAWSEIWLPGRGWIRVDPTAAVAPDRIAVGLRNSVGEEDAALLGGAFSSGLIFTLRHYWDAFGYQWHRWVLSYDEESQNSIFEKWLGGTDIWRIALLFLGACGSLLTLYFLSLAFSRESSAMREEDKVYALFLRKLARKGFVRHQQESPTNFARRVASGKATWQREAIKITSLYCKVAYEGDPRFIPSFKKAVKQFSLP